MATANVTEYDYRIPEDVIPTAETKVKLAGEILISPLVVGTWAWGDKTIWTWEERDRVNAKTAFNMAISKGINTFDTAEVYGDGESERSIAQFRTDQNADMVILTKFFPYLARLSYPKSLISALEESIKRLNVPCVDLYQIHGPIHLRSIKVMAAALAEAMRRGLTKAVGVCNYSAEEMIEMYNCLREQGFQLASNQVEFSLLRRLPEISELIKECHQRGVAVLGYGPLAMGRLTGKYSQDKQLPKNRSYPDMDMKDVEPLIEKMKVIANEHGVNISAVALNYVICKGVIPLAGARDAKQAEENAAALGWRLTPGEIDDLEAKSLNPKPHFMSRLWQHG